MRLRIEVHLDDDMKSARLRTILHILAGKEPATKLDEIDRAMCEEEKRVQILESVKKQSRIALDMGLFIQAEYDLLLSLIK